jgi:hypothetical protein
MTDFLWLWESQIAVRGTRPYCVGKLDPELISPSLKLC